jgi:hypothetical protein
MLDCDGSECVDFVLGSCAVPTCKYIVPSRRSTICTPNVVRVPKCVCAAVGSAVLSSLVFFLAEDTIFTATGKRERSFGVVTFVLVISSPIQTTLILTFFCFIT